MAAGIVVYSRSDRDQAHAAALQPVPVIAATVQQHDFPIVLTGLGTVTALNHARILIEMRKGFGRIIRWVTRNATPERMKWKKIHKLGENQFADGGSKNPSKSLRNR